MLYIHSKEELQIPEGGAYLFEPLAIHEEAITRKRSPMLMNSSPRTVKVHIKTRIVTVEGPRGKLTKNLGHLAVSFSHPRKDMINIELHHGTRKNVATLRTVRSIINNLIIGVTKGYKYKMRYVYAHFPINVNVDKNSETGLYNVEIR